MVDEISYIKQKCDCTLFKVEFCPKCNSLFYEDEEKNMVEIDFNKLQEQGIDDFMTRVKMSSLNDKKASILKQLEILTNQLEEKING